MERISKMFRNEEGQILVFVAIAMVAIMGFSALAIDVGMVSIQKSNLQNAADAAALAGAQDIGTGKNPVDTAIKYANENGEGISTSVNPTNTDTTKIEVVCTKTVKHSFARVLGFTQTDVSARAVAKKTIVAGEAFNYAVFAGEGEASFNGNGHVFDGGVYGRDGVSLGNGAEVVGDVVSVKGKIIDEGNKSTISGSKIKVEEPLKMPDLSEIIKDKAGSEVYMGNTTFNGKVINGPVYVDGNLTVNGRIQGNGIICATGTITFKDGNISQNLKDSVCFYAKKGGMTFNGGSGVVIGILYAPNGKITVNGAPNSLTYGRIIAREVDMNGAKSSIYAGKNDLNAFSELTTVSLAE